MSNAKLYAVFGLLLLSDIELEALDLADDQAATPDVEVMKAKGIARGGHSVDPLFDIRPDVQYFHWDAIGVFVIETEAKVLVELHDGVSDLLASHALLGLVMSVVIERRGMLCLHASAVSIDGRGIVFLGDKGAGKSTITGSLLQRGHPPISDDLVPVELPSDKTAKAIMHPAFSMTKLYPDSAEALGFGHADTDREIHHTTQKKQKQMLLPVTKSVTPVGAVCVLFRSADIENVQFESLSAHMALEVIMRFTFKARYGETAMGRDSLIKHMQLCSGLVARAKVYTLHVPHNLDRLPELAEKVEQHMFNLT